MSEPTLEQMIEAVKAIYPDAEECFYQRYGVPYRGIVTELTLAEQLHDKDIVPRDLWRDAYSNLPKPSLRNRDLPEKMVEDVLGTCDMSDEPHEKCGEKYHWKPIGSRTIRLRGFGIGCERYSVNTSTVLEA